MKNKCIKCKKELSSIYDFGKCYECRRKEDITTYKIMGVIVIGVLSGIIGIKLLFAKVVYQDMRCAFADCRIIK